MNIAARRNSARTHQHAAVLEAVKVWPASIEFVSTPERRPTLTASPRDGLGIAWPGRKNGSAGAEQKNWDFD